MSNSFSINKLKSLRKQSKSAEKRLIDYLLENITDIKDMNIDTLAENSNVSYATVCRLFRKLGFNGFKAFKKSLTKEISDSDSLSYDFSNVDLMQNYTTEQLCKNVCTLSSGIIDNCLNSVSTNDIEKTIHLISNAKSIYFVGLGTSAVSAQYAYTKLFRLRIPCSVDTDIIISKMKAALLKKDDVLFAVSSSGRTKSIIEIAQIAKSNGAKVVSLCDFALSPLSKRSDVSLYTTARDSYMYVNDDFPLIQGQITIIDMIYACRYNKTNMDSKQQFEKTKNTVLNDKV